MGTLGNPHPGFTQDLADEICERLSQGQTLVEICRDEHMPVRRTITKWRKAHPEFDKAYDIATLEGCHALLDETIDIADDSRNDWIERENDRGGGTHVELNSEAVQRSKLRIWARHELVKRKRPDVFSDKVQLQHSGSIQSLSDAEVEARYAALMMKAGTEDAAVDPDGD